MKEIKEEILEYMCKVGKLLDMSEDLFARQHKGEIYSKIIDVATENFNNCGDPTLSEEQLTEVYNQVKRKKGEPGWEYILGFKICLN